MTLSIASIAIIQCPHFFIIMLNVIKPNVIMLNVIMLNVVVPRKQTPELFF
jgi:hypothetical protein